MRMTLLEIVQNILSAADGEEVTSISDTVESAQCALEVENTFYDLVSNNVIPQHNSLITFEASGDSVNHPNVLKVADAVDNFEWVKYNVQTTSDPLYKKVTRLDVDDFMDKISAKTSGTLVYDVTTDLPYYIDSTKHPEYYTTFDDEYLVFDSYNSAVDTALQAAKAMGWGQTVPTFSQSDTHTPDIGDKYFPLLLAEAKAAFWVNYKGVVNNKEEKRARRQRVRIQNNKYRNRKPYSEYDFGRS